jgi:hypothetical protein
MEAIFGLMSAAVVAGASGFGFATRSSAASVLDTSTGESDGMC